MPKHELNNDDTNEHAKVDGEKPIRSQSYIKNHRQQRKVGGRRGGLLQERAHYLVLKCQMVICPKYTDTKYHID